MPAVRLDRFLGSTALVLLLTAAPGAFAQTATGTGPDAVAVTQSPDGQTAIKPAAGPEAEAPAKVIDSAKEQAAPASAATTATETKGLSVEPATTATATPPDAAGVTADPTTAGTASDTKGPTVEPAATATAPAMNQEPPVGARKEPGSPTTVATPSPTIPAVPAATTATAPATAPATTTATAPAPITTTAATPAADALGEADAAIVDQLRGLAVGKFDRIVGGKKERTIIDAFYSGRDYKPLWIADGKANERATAAAAYLRQVDTDGLDPADYPVPDFAARTDPASLAEAELRLTVSVLAYAHHAQIGRVHWSRVSADIAYDQKPPDAADVLAGLVEAKDVGEALAAYEPQNPAYLALKAKLAEIRAGKTEPGKAQIANGPMLKVGMSDARVPELRERLEVAGDGNVYDKALGEAVKKFQREHQLKVTGMLTPATVEALNGRQPDRPTDIILANMERWRWMPHDLGKLYVIVNLPDFTLRVMHDDKLVWMTKIVDGKPNMPTPIMSAEMKYITVNPTWNVPPSIVAKEYMPVLQQDSSVLARMGLKVSQNPDGTVHISQPPGERNALGRLRFNFPNKFLVYQHDTPEKHLFAMDKRAFSHGCMRVQDPVKYAEVLLSLVRPGEGYTEDRIRRMFGTAETDIQLPKFVPVHLTYQTAFVDDAGKLEFRDDVYGRDKALLAILKSDERKVADIAIERRENPIRRAVLALPDQGSFWGGWGGGGRNYYAGGGGGGFFDRLFGNSYAAQPAPVTRRGQRRTERTERTESSGFPW